MHVEKNNSSMVGHHQQIFAVSYMLIAQYIFLFDEGNQAVFMAMWYMQTR